MHGQGPARARRQPRTSSPARCEAASTRPHAMHDPNKGIRARLPTSVSVALSDNENGLPSPCKDLHTSGTTKTFAQRSCGRRSLFLQKQAEGVPSSRKKAGRRAGRSGILRPPAPLNDPHNSPKIGALNAQHLMRISYPAPAPCRSGGGGGRSAPSVPRSP